jgi:Uncharacterised protein family (UPF0158)
VKPDALRTLFVRMDEILDAIDTYGDDTRFYLDTETGEVSLWMNPLHTGEEAAFDPHDDRYAQIPQRVSRESYRDMERFVLAIDEEDVRRELQRAIEGKGAFDRFRRALSGYPDLRARWEQGKRDALLAEAVAWLATLGIEPQYELRPIAGTRPGSGAGTPQHLQGQAAVGLLDLLLLGGPDGRKELLGERVRRVHVSPTPEHARKVFSRIARELAEQHGLAWRKRMIEDTNAFEIERYTVTHAGRRVELAVEVPRPVRVAFSGTDD